MRLDIKRLAKIATLQRDHSYSPYSNVPVGCVLQCATPRGEKIAVGASMENAVYSLSVCAERITMWQAQYHGIAKYAEVMVISCNVNPPPAPCGACCQVMIELLPPDCKIIVVDMSGAQRKWKVKELLPHALDS